MNASAGIVAHTRLGLWLGGSVLLHALALPLFDGTAERSGVPAASLHVTLLGPSPAPRGATSASAGTPITAQPAAEGAAPDDINPVSLAVDPVVNKPRVTSAETSATVSASTSGRDNDRSANDVPRPPTPPVHRATSKPPQVARRTTSVAKPATTDSAAEVLAPGPTLAAATPSARRGAAAHVAVGAEARDGAAHAAVDAASHAAFVQLLHAAIDGHKRYPRLARRQRREGTATILFRLHPDGGLDALELHDSSGFAALDEAALRAVAAVAPFAPAARFLTRETHFRVGVEFHLY